MGSWRIAQWKLEVLRNLRQPVCPKPRTPHHWLPRGEKDAHKGCSWWTWNQVVPQSIDKHFSVVKTTCWKTSEKCWSTYALSWPLSYYFESNYVWTCDHDSWTLARDFCPDQSWFKENELPLTDTTVQLVLISLWSFLCPRHVSPMMERRRAMNCWLAAMKGPTSSLIDRLANTRITLISTSSILLIVSLVDSDSSAVVDKLTASLPCRKSHSGMLSFWGCHHGRHHFGDAIILVSTQTLLTSRSVKIWTCANFL